MIIQSQMPQSTSKTDMELVEQKKHEYYFLGTLIRRAGLKLFAFDPLKQEIYELKIKYSNTIHAIPQDGELMPIDLEAAKCTIDSRHEVFEALNTYSATKRVLSWKQGKIKGLCNLRRPNPNGLKLF